ncbi:myb-like protein V [Battus philenor]|uniref:myb-like protein V n=1 Tax=Battus philenor TaxID=42288 RepID=UPI0035D00C6C
MPRNNDKDKAVQPSKMVSDINRKGRRSNIDSSNSELDQEDDYENIKDDIINNDKGQTVSEATRNTRSVQDYEEILENFKRKSDKSNKKNDSKNLLNRLRSTTYPPIFYNEDEQRRQFFSKIFALFDEDGVSNARRLDAHNENSKERRPASIDQVLIGKISLDKREPTHDYPLESDIKHFLSDKKDSKSPALPENSNVDESILQSDPNTLESKHNKKIKRKRLAKENRTRPERELSGLETIDDFENEDEKSEDISDLTFKTRRKNKTILTSVDEESIHGGDENFKSSTVNSVSRSVTSNSEQSSTELAYIARKPSFNAFEPDIATTPDRNEFITDVASLVSHSIIKDSTLDISSTNEPLNPEQDKSNVEDTSTTEIVTNPQIDESDLISISWRKNDEPNVEADVVDNKSELLSKNDDSTDRPLESRDDLDISEQGTTDLINDNIVVNKIEDNMKVLATNQLEQKSPAVIGKAELVNPLSARIKLDLFIQIPSRSNDNNSPVSLNM